MASALTAVGVLALIAVVALAWRSQRRSSLRFLDDLRSVQGAAITLAMVTRESQGLTRLLEVPCQLISVNRQGLAIELEHPLPSRVPGTAASPEGVVVVPLRLVAFADTPRGRMSAAGWASTVDVGPSASGGGMVAQPSKAAGPGGWFGPRSPARIAFVVLCVVLGIAVGLFLPVSSLIFRIVGTAALVAFVMFLSRRSRTKPRS